jgi:hypothetical protein
MNVMLDFNDITTPIQKIADLRADFLAKHEAWEEAYDARRYAYRKLELALRDDAADQLDRVIHDQGAEVKIIGFCFADSDAVLCPVVRCRLKTGEWGKVAKQFRHLAFDHLAREWCERDSDDF